MEIFKVFFFKVNNGWKIIGILDFNGVYEMMCLCFWFILNVEKMVGFMCKFIVFNCLLVLGIKMMIDIIFVFGSFNDNKGEVVFEMI